MFEHEIAPHSILYAFRNLLPAMQEAPLLKDQYPSKLWLDVDELPSLLRAMPPYTSRPALETFVIQIYLERYS